MVKHWSADLVEFDPSSRQIFSVVNGVPLHTAFHYQPLIILIWLKYCWKGRKIARKSSILKTKVVASQRSALSNGVALKRCCYSILIHNDVGSRHSVVWNHGCTLALRPSFIEVGSCCGSCYHQNSLSPADFASSTRAAENRSRWKGIVANSSVVPRRPSKVMG